MNDLCAALDGGFARLGPLCKEVEQGVAAMDSELREVTPALDRAVIRLRRWVDREANLTFSRYGSRWVKFKARE